MNLPSPRQLGILSLLPQRPAELPENMLVQLGPCVAAGWASVDHGFYQLTPLGVAAISQACKEPIR